MAKSKRGGSSEIAMLELAPRSFPPNAKGALTKARTIIVAARDFIEPVTIKRMVCFAIGRCRRGSSSKTFSKPTFGNERLKSSRGRRPRLQGQPAAHILGQRTRPIALVVDAQARCMQGVSFQQQSPGQFVGPTGIDESKIKILVRAVDFITDNRMPERSEMHTNLMGAAGQKMRLYQRKQFTVWRLFLETFYQVKFCHRFCAAGINHML